MKKVNKMTLKELLDSTDLLMHLSDILYCCEDFETIKEFADFNTTKSNLNFIEIKDFLIKHEDKINKQKLLLVIVKNYYENINLIDSILATKTSNSSNILDLIVEKKNRRKKFKYSQTNR